MHTTPLSDSAAQQSIETHRPWQPAAAAPTMPSAAERDSLPRVSASRADPNAPGCHLRCQQHDMINTRAAAALTRVHSVAPSTCFFGPSGVPAPTDASLWRFPYNKQGPLHSATTTTASSIFNYSLTSKGANVCTPVNLTVFAFPSSSFATSMARVC